MIREVCACKAEFEAGVNDTKPGLEAEEKRLTEWREHHAKVCPFRSERISLDADERVEVAE